MNNQKQCGKELKLNNYHLFPLSTRPNIFFLQFEFEMSEGLIQQVFQFPGLVSQAAQT